MTCQPYLPETMFRLARPGRHSSNSVRSYVDCLVATSSGTHTCSLIRNVEALLVEAQGLASLTGMKAEVLQVVLDAAEPPSRGCSGERLNSVLHFRGHWLLRKLVDALHHLHIVGHELIEWHIQHLI